MEHSTLKAFITSRYPEEQIHKLDININPHNEQMDSIKVIFKDGIIPEYDHIGHILCDIDTYTFESDYGDMTEATIKISTYEEVNDDILNSIEFLINIDS